MSVKKKKPIITLQQRVEALEGDPVIHVGASSAFFFIGKRSEYEADIDTISDRYTQEAEKELAEMQKILDEFPAQLAKLKKLMRKTENPDKLEELGWACREVAESAFKIPQVQREIDKKRKYVEEFTPFRDREAAEPYDRFQGDGVVIVVKGPEKGAYWLREEYLTGEIQFDNEDDEEIEEEIEEEDLTDGNA